MRPLALAWLLVTGCAAAPPGEPLTEWERADAPDPHAEAPEEPPEGLVWQPVESSADLVFDVVAPALWLRAHTGCREGWRDPVAFLPKTYVGVAAYWRGRRVGPRVSYRYASGTPWYAVPVDCEADTITFRLTSRYTQIGFPIRPRVGERADLIASLLAPDVPRVVLAILFLLIGLGAGLLSVGSRERRALVGLSIYGLSLSSWTLFHTRTKQLWLPEMELWFSVWWVSVPLIALGAALFIEGFFGPGPRRLVRWLVVALAVTCAAAALSLLLVGDAFRTAAAPVFVAGRGLSVLGALLVVAFLGGLARRGDAEARLLLGGLTLAFVSVVRDIALSLGWVEGSDTWTQYGYAVFGLTLVLLVRRRIVTLQVQVTEYADSLDRYVRERDLLMKDLHDGLGGIVTNVRMLAERDAEEPRTGVLEAISTLAADGINELRTLIFGFDGPPQTWSQVAAELRRAGGLALEANGIEHHFERVVDEAVPRPDLRVVVNVMRIHREALTNALKHAKPGRVEVSLRVRPDGLELRVSDDGAGLDAPASNAEGVGLGKGVASMRARAKELGGALTIESDRGVTVLLRAPLPRR